MVQRGIFYLECQTAEPLICWLVNTITLLPILRAGDSIHQSISALTELIGS